MAMGDPVGCTVSYATANPTYSWESANAIDFTVHDFDKVYGPILNETFKKDKVEDVKMAEGTTYLKFAILDPNRHAVMALGNKTILLTGEVMTANFEKGKEHLFMLGLDIPKLLEEYNKLRVTVEYEKDDKKVHLPAAELRNIDIKFMPFGSY
jgi:hypothetical protein